jgi:class 3 adenylate cyclase
MSRVAEPFAIARLRRLFAALGPYSPLATLRTYTPASRILLAEAERAAEIALHGVRAVFWLLMALLVSPEIGFTAPKFAPLMILGVLIGVAVWAVIWQMLRQPVPPGWLRYGLIVLDGWLAVRSALLFNAPFRDRFVSMFGMPQISLPDLEVLTPALLVFLALSGALRIDVWAAMLSTVVALAGYAFFAASIATPIRQALPVAAIIGFAGVVGANGARILRYMVLKARQEAVLERYVPQGLTRELKRSGSVDRPGRQEELTLLIADIRGYSRLTERLEPAQAVALLNQYFAVVAGALAAEDAVLDKYIGDGILAFFEGADHATRGLRAARGMLARLDEFNAARAGQEPLRIGIAVHTGEVLVGTIGAPIRREYTLIGDAVNVTARLEECNKRFNAVLIASATTLARTTLPADDLCGPELVDLRGRGAPIAIHYLPAAYSERSAGPPLAKVQPR